jgi:fumarate hydratase subunit alpha
LNDIYLDLSKQSSLMRTVEHASIIEAVKNLSMEANYDLATDVVTAFEKGKEQEESPTGKAIFSALLKNQNIARDEEVPMCQDTGFSVIYVELGQDVHIKGGSLEDSINEGVRQGYADGYLRKSMCEPFTRKNTGDNTPAIIITEIVSGNKMKIVVAPKGGGSENMSRVTMLKPADGKEGIKEFVVNRCLEAGSNPCPPVIVGVGIGGSSEKAAILARKSLFREIGSKNPDPELSEMEADMLKKINDLGMGPQGLGGTQYALAVHIEKFPCHIAQLPVGVNICCHAARHKEVVL